MQPTASFTWSALEYFDSYKRSLNETKTKHIPFHKPTNDNIPKELPEVYINPLTSKSTNWFLYDGNIGS